MTNHLLTPRSKPFVFSVSASFALVTSLILLVNLLQTDSNTHKNDLIIRQTDLFVAAPPPPPPPKTTQQHQSTDISLDLSVDGEGPSLMFDSLNVSGQMTIDAIQAPDIYQSNIDWNDSLAIDWNAFGLGDLDEMPRLLTSLKIKFPTSLSKRGVDIVKIELDVVIDEVGRVTLRKINRNPHPELKGAINKLVRNARFSTPKRNGSAVRAAFNWPLEIKNT